jgi:hypothetical protein
MLIPWVADYKFKALLEFVHAMYVYHPDVDVYIPRMGAVDGSAMRTIMDLASQRSLAYGYDAHSEQFLTQT